MTFNTDIQKTEKEIAVLQKKLELLKEIETHKSQPKMEFDFGGKFEVVSYNNENYYRLEFDDESHSWYKRKEKLDGNLLKQITDGETHRLLEGVWFNDVKHGKYDDEVSEPKSQTLYNRLYDELSYDFDSCNDIVDLVEDWLPKTFQSYGEYQEGWNDCIEEIREKLR
jgi:hypothetical protein